MAQHFPDYLSGTRCPCGHGVEHPSVEEKPVFGFIGWLKLLNGIDTIPKKIEYRCRDCGSVVGVTRDVAVRREFR